VQAIAPQDRTAAGDVAVATHGTLIGVIPWADADSRTETQLPAEPSEHSRLTMLEQACS
jgi:hypothetical protein